MVPRAPPWGRLRRTVGLALLHLLGLAPEPIDWAAHERIMAQIHFSGGLRADALVRDAGFGEVRTGSIDPIRRAQRRAAGFARGLTVGVYHDFWMTAVKPAA